MKLSLLVSVLAASIFFVASAQAGLLVGTATNITWNRATAPSGSPTVTVPIFFDGLSGQSSLTSLTLAMKFSGGTAGTLNFSNPANPNTNPLFATLGGTPAFSPLGNGISAVGADNSTATNVAPGLSPGRNALTFNFTSTNALGVFSLLYDLTFSEFFTVGVGDLKFANADNFQIATITVTNDGASVPEPAFLGILVMTPMLGALALRWRRQLRATKASKEVAVPAS